MIQFPAVKVCVHCHVFVTCSRVLTTYRMQCTWMLAMCCLMHQRDIVVSVSLFVTCVMVIIVEVSSLLCITKQLSFCLAVILQCLTCSVLVSDFYITVYYVNFLFCCFVFIVKHIFVYFVSLQHQRWFIPSAWCARSQAAYLLLLLLWLLLWFYTKQLNAHTVHAVVYLDNPHSTVWWH